MTDLQKLEWLYNEKIKIDESKQGYYRGLLHHMMNEFIIPELKKINADFAALYSHTYFGGSLFDGLKVRRKIKAATVPRKDPIVKEFSWKVGSTEQEFDLNIIFKWNKNACEIVHLGQDPKKKNFAYIMVTKSDLTQSESKIVFNDIGSGVNYISPKKVKTSLGGRV